MRRIDRSYILYVLERLLSLGVTFASGVIVIRMLGADGFAVYAAIVGLGQFASTFGKLSLDEFLANRFAAGEWGRFAEIVVVAQRLMAGIAAAGVLWAMTPAFGKSDATIWHLAAVAAFALVESLAFQEVKLQASGAFGRLSLLGTLRSTLGLAVRITLWLSGVGTVGAMLAVALAELVVFRVGSYVLQPAHSVAARGSFRFPPMTQLASFLGLTILTLSYSRIDFVIGLYALESAEFGTYMAAQRFLEAFAFLANVLGALLMPRVATLPRDAAFAFALRTSFRFGLIGLALCMLNVLFLATLLPSIAGNSYPRIDQYYSILAVGLIPLYAGLPLGRVALAQGRPIVMVTGAIVAVSATAAFFLVVFSSMATPVRLPWSLVCGNSIGCAVVLGLVATEARRSTAQSSAVDRS